MDSNVQKKDGKVIKSKQIAKSRLTDAKSELKQALLASTFHVASSLGETYHTLPKTSDSWC